MMLRRIAAGVAGLLLAAAVAAATLDEDLATARRDAGRLDPADLMMLSAKLQQAGRNDDALFWFLAGQLRMRYVLAVSPDENRSLVFASLVASIGMAVYPAFNGDGEKLAAGVDRVLEWDRVTPVDFSWLKDRKQLPREQWPPKFTAIREGMLKLKAEFLAMPKDECERLAQGTPSEEQAAKSRADLQRSWHSESNRKRVEEGFSTGLAIVTTGGVSFRLPKNFVSPFGFRDSVDYQQRAVEVFVFLPGFGGYTRDNWVERMNPDKIQVNILPNKQYTFMSSYAEVTGKAGAPLREVAGLKVYKHPTAHKCFPEELLAGTLAGGAPVYGSCLAMGKPYAGCSVYFYAPDKAYTLSMGLRPARLPDWREMTARATSLVESWRYAAR